MGYKDFFSAPLVEDPCPSKKEIEQGQQKLKTDTAFAQIDGISADEKTNIDNQQRVLANNHSLLEKCDERWSRRTWGIIKAGTGVLLGGTALSNAFSAAENLEGIARALDSWNPDSEADKTVYRKASMDDPRNVG